MKVLNYLPSDKVLYNEIKLIKSGNDFLETLLMHIDSATTLIHLQFYIFHLDETGIIVLDALKRATNRGVKVFVVVDAYGSEHLTKDTVTEWLNFGIHLKRFSTIKNKNKIRIGRRLHHKVLWVDGKVALIGGINIANTYTGLPKQTPWLDYAVEIKGEGLLNIKHICEEILPKRILKHLPDVQLDYNSIDGVPTALVQNDWLRSRYEISSLYRSSIKNAQKEIVIVASYFLPGNRVRRLLRLAVERGVQVKVVLVGKSDVPFMKAAMQYLYDWMFRQQIQVYEWQPSVLHAKMMTIDNVFTTIGSYNLNALSDYGSLELNIAVEDELFARKIQNELQTNIFPNSIAINPFQFKKQSNFFARTLYWLSYVSIRMALRLLFVMMQTKTPTDD